MDGTLGNERAPLQDGRKCDYGPYYQCSTSLQSLNVIPSLIQMSILVKKVRIKHGTLRYHWNDENKCMNVSKDHENYFNAIILKKVNIECHGEGGYPANNELFLALHRLLTERRNWEIFETGWHIWCCWCILIFIPFDTDVWRAFCEVWGPLTNTLHHGAGEGGVSLYEAECGLPIPGAVYEEFLPPNKDLADDNKYTTTVVELLYIHVELCKFHNVGHIYYDLWLDHFYREYLHMGNKRLLKKGKLRQRKGAPFASLVKSE
ncbi:LOW QUALITY PROTEIN: hypothetical protein Cgig2_021726 [Carnegiea gigantea]|uniref:Uncharacterized protein n=1 Tax=Carnegiea gigantea TaxID=171969 RepID=A0A9Q1JT68_9CARY|nr:LOW QUALITY PROTEIN: hypothetical protein Cgig2_021726 [Carnegiea gigantea]